MTKEISVNLDIELSKTGELFLIGSYLLKKVLPVRLSAPLQAWVFKRFCRVKVMGGR